MKIHTVGFVLIIAGWHTVQAADDAALKKVIKGKVGEINQALIKEDFEKVVDLTHPKLVELAGGREKMVSLMKTGNKDMQAKGIKIVSAKIDEPSDTVKSGPEWFVVVPFTLEMKAPGGRLLTKSFVIGVSTDKGKTWSFVNGDVDLKMVKQVLPTLPASLKLPTKQKPVFEKEKD